MVLSMNIYIYSDESGVFDKVHNDYYVYGGLILLGKKQRDDCIHKYANVEKVIRSSGCYVDDIELKACFLSNKDKAKIYRSLNGFYKFACIVKEKYVHDLFFAHKKDKQRYLDYVYKLGVKNALQEMMEASVFAADDVDDLCFYIDEHTTATNGLYELREGIEEEFKRGTLNFKYNRYFPPILPKMSSVNLQYCNSAKVRLVRAADIIANHIFHAAVADNISGLYKDSNLFIKIFP